MMKIDVYKNGEFTRVTNIISVIYQKTGILELINSDGEAKYYYPFEFDWFTVLQ